jgi:hypothetical protein
MCDLTTAYFSTDKKPIIQKNVEELVNAQNKLFPADTHWDKKVWQDKPFDFPNLYLKQEVPLWKSILPISTKATIQNELLVRRHFNK